jgi:hypothetical protein
MKTTTNNTTNNNTNEQKTRSLKCLANDAAKAEMFSLKQATAAVKNAYDQDKERKDTRAYIEQLGFSANVFKSLQWQDLQDYATTKSGRFSTWAVLNALAKYATAKDIKGEQAAKAARKEEKAAIKAAKERMKAKQAAQRKAETSKWLTCTNIVGAIVGYQRIGEDGNGTGKVYTESEYLEIIASEQAAAKKCTEKAQRRAAKKTA